jgi:hypothetical protein
VSNGAISSIDQVFNGFGYIGSTMFALPGVKGLIPDGRNADGTLKNNPFETTSVLICQATYNADYAKIGYTRGFLVYVTDNDVKYDSIRNICYLVSSEKNWGGALIGSCSVAGLSFSSVAPKTTFRAIDYNDTDFIAHQVMPSNRRIDLTLGASGASYTAPADGWLVLNKLSSGTSYQFVQFYNTKNADRRIGTATTNNAYLCATMPLAKGDRVLVEYSATGDTKLFRFIYANGAK